MVETATPVRDVSHVSISVSDMDRSIRFYRDALGWQQVFDTEVDPQALERLLGIPGARVRACGGTIGSLRVELMCLSYVPQTSGAPGLGLRVLSLRVDDAEAAHAFMKARGVPTQSAPVVLHGMKMFFIQDPDGQGIELCEYLPEGSGWGGAPV